ncbi:MAG: rod shape-determining protein MreD [Piscirickettsiaceae bacterium]|jgi:rod shape-determining protein MreD|nr:rod shape-determining protein MreD [Piscirickettsiaceae bacterium]
MAIVDKPQGGLIIVMSVLLAMILMLMPLPDSFRFFRPEWVLLTLMYWAMALPRRVGVGYAWLVGLFMDVLFGGTLGILAFAYALVIYLVLHFHLQLRQFPLWQQALSLMSLILLVHVVTVVMTTRVTGWHAWLPAMVSTLLWPVIYIFLRGVRRTFHVR